MSGCLVVIAAVDGRGDLRAIYLPVRMSLMQGIILGTACIVHTVRTAGICKIILHGDESSVSDFTLVVTHCAWSGIIQIFDIRQHFFI